MSVTIDGSNGVTTNSGAVYNGLQTGTSVSASGTSVTFSSIPSWVKRITVMIQGISTNGTSIVQIQVGSGSATTTGYLGTGSGITASGGSTQNSSGFLLGNDGNAAYVRHGAITLTNLSGNVWVASGVISYSNQTITAWCSGSISLSGTLDRVILTTVNGTDTFDAGSVNIIYE